MKKSMIFLILFLMPISLALSQDNQLIEARDTLADSYFSLDHTARGLSAAFERNASNLNPLQRFPGFSETPSVALTRFIP